MASKVVSGDAKRALSSASQTACVMPLANGDPASTPVIAPLARVFARRPSRSASRCRPRKG